MEEDSIEKIKNMTEDQVRQKARLKTIEIEDMLEKKAKRIRPEVFVPYLLRVYHDPERKIVIGPHTILQSLEANCAYHKDGYDEEMSWRKFAEIINLVRKIEEENDFYLWLTSKNIDLFFQFINRIQLETQKTGNFKINLARYWKIFFDNNLPQSLLSLFASQYKISIEKWFLCSICLLATFNDSLIIIKNFNIQDGININKDDIQSYLKLSSYSVNEIKRRYFDIRGKISPEFHFLIRTAFM